ncbi:MAG: sulfatase-like hydrolase/transferase [Paludibacter sp.]|nr:sulfatase-like hydrolase/transferase [Paludibacter sp.]
MSKQATLSLSVIPLFLPALIPHAKASDKMNIVVILADDLGWGDVGFHFSEVKTPNIDKLAQDGIILDRFYTAPVSSPTRAGLLTGRYPNRFGIRETVIPPWRDFGLDVEEETLADILGKAGYDNRAIVGKWHLGHSRKEYHPLSRGFTHFYGHLNGALNYFTHLRDGQLDWHNDWNPCYDTGYTTDLITAESVQCINEYSQSENPFFLYVAFNAPHSPLLAKEEDIALYTSNFNQLTPDEKDRVTYSAMVTCMDRGVGAIRKALQDRGIEDNTLIIFFSDNGGDPNFGATSTPLRGGKFQEFDGGVRSPAIVSYPAKWAGKRTIKQVVGFVDIMPTIRSLLNVGGAPKRPFDGMDISSLLSGQQPVLTRDLYLGCGAVVNNNYKLILKGKNEKVKLSYDFLSYYPDQFYEETNMWNKPAHQTEFARLKKMAQEYDAIVSPFILPPYGEGQDDFKAPFEWNMDYYGKTYQFPYPIATFEDLMVVRNNLDKEFYLTNDIIIPDSIEWVPLGAALRDDSAPVKFSGKIDGKGFSVKNIHIASETACKGFIGQMENSSVTNLGIENVNIKGTLPVGGLVGQLLGNNRIDQVTVTGTIQGTEEVGGLAGKSIAGNSVISNSFVDAQISGSAATNAKVGGLIGHVASNALWVTDGYVAGTVRAINTGNTSNYAGGLFGVINSPNTVIADIIKAGSVAVVADEISGGTPNLFFGTALQTKTLVHNNIFARNDIPLNYAGTNHGTGAAIVTPGMLLSHGNFLNQNFFQLTLGWDFNTIWEMRVGTDYPVLRTNPLSSTPVLVDEKSAWRISNLPPGIKIDTSQPISIQIHDMSGRMVHASLIQQNSVIALSRGFYILTVNDSGREYTIKTAVCF